MKLNLGKLSLLILPAALALTACNQVADETRPSVQTTKTSVQGRVFLNGETCVKLIAGQTNVIGTVCNVVDGGDLVVTVSTKSGMDNVYLWAGTVWDSWPKKAKNNPSPAHASFPYLSPALAGATSYTTRIPLSKYGIDYKTFCGNTPLYMILHASGSGYTAFGAFNAKDLDVSGGGNWAYGYKVNIVGPPAPRIAFADSAAEYITGDSVKQVPAALGGPATSCSVSPALPAGLNLDTTCGITGVPTTPFSQIFTVTAIGQCGTSSSRIKITVCPPAPKLSNVSGSFTIGSKTPVSLKPDSVGGPFYSCELLSILPSGLSFDNKTCAITGTPTIAALGTNVFKVKAIGLCKTAEATVTLEVVCPPKPVINDASSSTVLGSGRSVSLLPASVGGDFGSCELLSTLPAGLSFNDKTCEISGVPTRAGTYELTVRAGGVCTSDDAVLTVTVLCPPAPAINDAAASFTLGSTTPVSLAPASVGGDFGTCELLSTLPAGLSFNNQTCEISGIPTREGTYALTVSANGICASNTATLTLTVKPAPVVVVPKDSTCFGAEQTATGRGIATGNWFMVIPVDANGNASVDLVAGQFYVAGHVTISGGVVTVTVGDGWAFNPGSVVAIGGYNAVPSTNLAPGKMPNLIPVSGSGITSRSVVSGYPYVFVHAEMLPKASCK